MLDAKMWSVLIFLLASALGPVPCVAQLPQIEGQALVQAREFANNSLQNYVTQVINQKNAMRFGFKSLKEAQAAKLGDPIPVFFIGLKPLKAYRSGAGAASVMTDTRTLWFPVLVNGEVRSKLEITEIRGKWVSGEFGRAKLARQVAGVHRELPTILQRAGAGKGARTYLVRIPALYVQLFFATGPTGDFFVPAQRGDLPSDIEVGKAYPADALLIRLAEAAKKVDEKTVR